MFVQSTMYSRMPKSGKHQNPNFWVFGYLHVSNLNVRALKFSNAFGLGFYELNWTIFVRFRTLVRLSDTNFYPKSEQNRSDFGRRLNSELSGTRSKVDRPKSEGVWISDVNCNSIFCNAKLDVSLRI